MAFEFLADVIEYAVDVADLVAVSCNDAVVDFQPGTLCRRTGHDFADRDPRSRYLPDRCQAAIFAGRTVRKAGGLYDGPTAVAIRG